MPINKKLICLFLFLLVSLNFASIGITYNSTTKVYDLFNDYHNFYVNGTSGDGLSNVPEEFWSKNILCVKASMISGLTISYPVQCFDKLSWIWQNVSDNKTFANLTGVAKWGIAKDYAVKITMEYYLTANDSRIQITPTIQNVGNRSTTAWIIWRVHDIKISNTKENDHITVLNNGTEESYLLNESLNLSYASLDNRTYFLADWVAGGWAQTWWESDIYELNIYKNKTEYNAFVDLSFPMGTLGYTGTTSTKTSSKMWWEDALCTYGCTMSAPTNIAINQLATFTWSGYYGIIAGTCPPTSNIYAEFYNTSWYSATATSNISITTGTNPQAGGNGQTKTWTGKGTDLGDYFVRLRCSVFGYGSVATGSSAVNVSAVPPLTCQQLSTNLTLTASNQTCYNVTSNNTIINCAGYTLYGDNTTPGFIIENGNNNVSISNCKLYGFTQTFRVSKATMLRFNNLTMLDNNYSVTSGTFDDAVGFKLTDASDVVINNVTQYAFGVFRNGASNTGGLGYFLLGLRVNNTIVANVISENNTGQYSTSAGEGTTLSYGRALRFTTSVNLSVSNASVKYLNGSSYEIMTSCLNCSFSNLSASWINNSAFYAEAPINLDVFSFTNVTKGVWLPLTASSSNISNGILSGQNATSLQTSSFAIQTGSNLNAISVKNVTANLFLYGLYFIQTYNSLIQNVSINNSDYCLWLKGDSVHAPTLTADRITCDWSNYSIYMTDGFVDSMMFSNSTLIQRNLKGDTINTLLSDNIIFLNTTANYTNVTIGYSTDDYRVEWYARANITDSTGSPLGATVKVNDTFSTPVFNGNSLSWFIVNDTNYTGAGNATYNNHTIFANLTGYNSNWTSINFTGRDYTVNLTLYLIPDTTPPILTFVYPTDLNLTVSRSWSYVNVSSNEPLSSAILNWNGTLYALTSLNSTVWYKNMTSLAEGNYTFNVTANDTALNSNITGTRWVNIDTTAPTITLVTPTAVNGANLSQNWIYANVSSNEALNTSVLNLNGTLYAMTRFNATNWYLNVTSLANGVYTYNVSANDTVNNTGASETRNLTLDTVAPTLAFVPITPINDSNLSQNWVYFNVTTSEPTVNASVVIDATTYYLTQNTSTNWQLNVSGLSIATHTYYAKANDSAGNIGTSETRTVTTQYCGVLPGSVTLRVDVSANNTCFDMIDGATLDCAGHSINYSTVSGAHGYGVRADAFVTGGSGSTIKNCIFNRGASTWQANGIRIYGTYGVNVDNVTIYVDHSTDAGIFLTGVNTINITNSNISCSGSPCQAVGSSANVEPTTNVEIWNSNLTAISGNAIYVINTNNFKVFNSNLTSDSYAIYFLGNVFNSTFKNNYISGSRTISTSSSNNYDHIFLNNTFPTLVYSLTASSNFTVQWYGRINTTNSTGSPLQALINDTDAQAQVAFEGQAGVNGLTNWFIVNDTKYSGTGNILYNNHSINASYPGYSFNQTNFNFSGQDFTANITLYPRPAVLTFVTPTPINNANLSQTWAYINVTSDIALQNASLDWNGTYKQMSNNSQTNWYLNVTSQPDGIYIYNVSVNSTYGFAALSETRNLTLDTTPPVLSFVPITPNDGATTNESFLTINISSNEALISAILNWNGTFYSMTQESPTLWNEFLAGLGNGVYYYNVSANDTLLNVGTSETRSLTINVTIPPVPVENVTYDFMGDVYRDLESRKSSEFPARNYFLASLPLLGLAFVGLWKKDWLVS